MENFIINSVLWTLALYGLFELIKQIIYMCTYTNLKEDGIYIIIAVKNQEERIEGFLRSILFKILYGKEEFIKDIIVTDLHSTDNTKEIVKKMSTDYECVKGRCKSNNKIKIALYSTHNFEEPCISGENRFWYNFLF